MSQPLSDDEIADALGLTPRGVNLLRAMIAEARPTSPLAVSTVVYVRDAAKALGISRDTLDDAIARLPEHQRPAAALGAGKGSRKRYYWPDLTALRAWWGEVTAPPPAPGAKGAPRSRAARRGASTLVGGAVTDWNAITKSLTKGDR